MARHRIGLMEIGTVNHYTYLQAMLEICIANNIEVTLFCSFKIEKLIHNSSLDTNQFQLVVMKDKERIYSFMKRVKKISNNSLDYFWVNTYQLPIKKTLLYLHLFPRIYSVITIHDVKTWLSDKIILRKILFNPINLIFYLSRKIILKKFSAIAVLEPQQKAWIRKETKNRKPIHTVPFCLNEHYSVQLSSDQLNTKIIVIPGTITNTRRDYNSLLSILKNNTFNSLRFVFAGRPTDSSGLQICNTLRSITNNDIEFFDYFIDDLEYKSIIVNSHFILINTHKFIKTEGFMEEYGKTKATGGIWNCIRFSKPGIIPDWMHSPQINESSLIRYDKKNLYNVLETINSLSLKDYNELIDNANKNSFRYKANSKYLEDMLKVNL